MKCCPKVTRNSTAGGWPSPSQALAPATAAMTASGPRRAFAAVGEDPERSLLRLGIADGAVDLDRPPARTTAATPRRGLLGAGAVVLG
jgi:hypothetical protein